MIKSVCTAAPKSDPSAPQIVMHLPTGTILMAMLNSFPGRALVLGTDERHRANESFNPEWQAPIGEVWVMERPNDYRPWYGTITSVAS